MKIIKYNNSKSKPKPYKIEEFTSVKRGETKFDLEPFSPDEHSVQDSHIETSMKGLSRPDSSSFSYTPSSSRAMFSTYDDELDMNALADANFETAMRPKLFSGYHEDTSASKRKSMFSQYEPDSEEEAVLAKITSRTAETVSVDETAAGADSGEFRETPLDGESLGSDDVSVPKSQQDTVKENALLKEAEEERAQLREMLAGKENEIAELKMRLQQAEAELPAKIAAAKDEERKAQIAEGERKYEAEKQDYINTVKKSWDEAIGAINKIDETIKGLDEQIPEIVVGYMRELIGTERKLNDKLVVNIIKSALSRLTDLQQIIFTVNPDDADAITEAFPQYGVSIDQTIPKGNVKVQTKVGEVDLSIDAWMDSLEKQINEQLKSS